MKLFMLHPLNLSEYYIIPFERISGKDFSHWDYMHVGKLLTMVFINLYLLLNLIWVCILVSSHFFGCIIFFCSKKGSRNHGFVRKEMIDFRRWFIYFFVLFKLWFIFVGLIFAEIFFMFLNWFMQKLSFSSSLMRL